MIARRRDGNSRARRDRRDGARPRPARPVRDHDRERPVHLKGKIFRIGHIGYFDVFDSRPRSPRSSSCSRPRRRDRARAAVTRASSVRKSAPACEARSESPRADRRAGVELLREHYEVDVGLNGDLAEQIGAYDAIVIRSATKLTGRRARAGDRLKVIGRAEWRRQRRRRDGHPTRIWWPNAPESDVRLRCGTHHRPAARTLAQHSAGVRAAEAGTLGARALRRHRARGQDARRARLSVASASRWQRARSGWGCAIVAYDPFVAKERFASWALIVSNVRRRYEAADFVIPAPAADRRDAGFRSGRRRSADERTAVRVINAARGSCSTRPRCRGLALGGKVAAATHSTSSRRSRTRAACSSSTTSLCHRSHAIRATRYVS